MQKKIKEDEEKEQKTAWRPRQSHYVRI